MTILRYIFKVIATLSVLAIPCSADAGLIAMGIVTLAAIPLFFLSLVGIGWIDERMERNDRRN